MRISAGVRGGVDIERGRSPLSLKHPSPAKKISHFLTMVLAGEGFILKGSP
jgi:hypothetical protein